MTKREILMQPNNIVKGRYNCTPTENKIFYKILFNAQKYQEDIPKYTAKVDIEDLKLLINNKNERTEQEISNKLLILHQTVLEFDYFDEEKKEVVTYKSGLIGESKFFHDSCIYEISIPEILYKHITNFIKMQSKGNGYTPLNLDLLFKFKGVYSQRMYTLFRLWSRESKEVEVNYRIDQLREYLKLQTDTYAEYKHLKQKIIKRAIKEINETGNMKVEIKKEIRKNRKVDEIVFSVIDYEPRKYFDKDNSLATEFIPEIVENVEDEQKELVEIYIPDETLFTKGTLRMFKLDFKGIDFKNEYMTKAFDVASMIALERDETDVIKSTTYNFFKSTLDNKIVEYKIEEKEDIEHKRNIELFW